MARLFDRIKQTDIFARDVPRFAPDDIQADYLTVLQSEIIRLCTEAGLLLGFMKDLWSISEPDRSLSLPWSARADLPEELQISGSIRFPHADTLVYSDEEKSFEIVHDGKRIRMDYDGAIILDRVLQLGDASIARLAELCPIPKDILLRKLSNMIQLGLLKVHEPALSAVCDGNNAPEAAGAHSGFKLR